MATKRNPLLDRGVKMQLIARPPHPLYLEEGVGEGSPGKTEGGRGKGGGRAKGGKREFWEGGKWERNVKQ